MSPIPSRREFLRIAAGGALLGAAGCGTVLHPERRGQPGGRLDWKIVALDAVGLLFFFVPGVIAFAVDFATGAIYLPSRYPPPGECGEATRGERPARLIAIRLPEDRLTPRDIERAVSRNTGRDVRLEPGEFRTQPLDRVEQFWSTHDRLSAGAGAADVSPAPS
ncbi:MAG: hypothetical protein WD069_01270 [Planctomycetales bacterium]